MAKLSVSLFAANIMHVERDLNTLRGMDIASLHIDVMDGHFVPLFGYNQMWIEEIRKKIACGIEIHMMAYLNDAILKDFIRLRPSALFFHVEAHKMEENLRYLRLIRAAGIRCGLAISPDTPCEDIMKYFGEIDEVLLMTAYPGREGAAFLESSYAKAEKLKKLIEGSQNRISIATDGALNRNRAEGLIGKGVEKVIIGRAFYSEPDKTGFIENIHRR